MWSQSLSTTELRGAGWFVNFWNFGSDAGEEVADVYFIQGRFLDNMCPTDGWTRYSQTPVFSFLYELPSS